MFMLALTFQIEIHADVCVKKRRFIKADLERDFNTAQEIICCFSSGSMQSLLNELAQAT